MWKTKSEPFYVQFKIKAKLSITLRVEFFDVIGFFACVGIITDKCCT